MNAYIFLTGRDAFLSKIQCGMFKGVTRAVFVDKQEVDGIVIRNSTDYTDAEMKVWSPEAFLRLWQNDCEDCAINSG